YYLGMILAREGSISKAEGHLRQAAMLIPDSPDIMYQLSDVLSQMNSEEAAQESEELLKKVLELNPAHAGALARKGLQAAQTGDHDQAIEALIKARDADPRNRELQLELGRALLAKGRAPEALEPLKIATQLNPADIEGQQLLGKCYEALNRPNEAAAAFALAKGKGKTAAAGKELVGYDLARNLAITGRAQEAIAEYQKMIKNASDPATGWAELGQLYQDLKERDKAISAYKKWFEIGGASEAAYRVAQIERESGNLEKAHEALSLITRQKDEWGERAKEELADIERELQEKERETLLEQADVGDEKNREKAFLKLLEMDKKDRDALEGLLELSKVRGDLEQAKYYTNELKKAGYLSKSEAKQAAEGLEAKQDAGDDIAAWEARLEDCKRDDDYDGAIEELLKLKAYSKSQLDAMKGSGDPSVKTTLRSRIQDYNRELKELRAKKRANRKKK
ncbi:MAG TPA: tetratricopeptide repeat protein, partial [Candidatus Ozemobacteraceae bacterium]|nr:tetratricopeptide repeat protein [Candidatus Ozemobacteraceae bacterium]